MVRLERKKLEEEEIYIPPIQVSFLKAVYVIHFEDMMDVPTQVLVVMGINTLKQDDNKVNSCNKKIKVVEK